MKNKLAILFAFTLSSTSLMAEYRVYQYIAKDRVKSAGDQPNSNIITSTLNPQSYLAYNGGSNLISLNLLRTWICPGDTSGFKELCESPYAKLPKESL